MKRPKQMNLRLIHLLSIGIGLLMAQCQPKTEKATTLTIHLSGYNDSTVVYLEELRARYIPFDTSEFLTAGTLKFDNPIEHTSFFRLKFSNGQTLPLILSPGQSPVMMLDGNDVTRNPTITNSPETSALFRSHEISNSFLADLSKIAYIFSDTTRAKPLKEEKDSLLLLVDTMFMQRKKAMRALLDDNAKRLSALPILLQTAQNHTFFRPDSDRQLFIDIDKHLIKQYGYQPQVRKFHYQLDSALYELDSIKGARVGDAMPDPMATTIWQEHLPISKFKGKPLLVFVWSSIDDESEASIPLIKQLWEEYNPKGLAVYMISVDSTETLWQSAIDQHRLACIHANDLKGNESPLFGRLGISSAPATFLVNREGNIVEKNIWGQPLQDAVKKLMEERKPN